MLIYILLIILSTIIFISHIYVKDEKVNFVTAFVWVLLMTLFVGSQDGIGTDHSNYIAQIESPWVVPSEPFTILKSRCIIRIQRVNTSCKICFFTKTFC